MTDNAPVGQVEAASDEQVASWKLDAKVQGHDETLPILACEVLALIVRIEAERDRASAAQAFIRQGRQGTEITELRELLVDARDDLVILRGDPRIIAAIEKKLSKEVGDV